MAMRNFSREVHQIAIKKAREEMKEFLKTKNGQKAFPKHLDFMSYLYELELDLEKEKEKNKKYRNFFNTLSSFLPYTGSRKLN